MRSPPTLPPPQNLERAPLGLTLPDLRGPPKAFSSITFDRDKILKRNFG